MEILPYIGFVAASFTGTGVVFRGASFAGAIDNPQNQPENGSFSYEYDPRFIKGEIVGGLCSTVYITGI